MKNTKLFFFTFVAGFAVQAGSVNLPQIPQKPISITAHGETRVDEFSWIREDGVMLKGAEPSTDLKNAVDAQNTYTTSVLSANKKLADVIKAELTARQKARDAEKPVPYVDRGYEYWQETKTGDVAPRFFRKKIGSDESELLVDGPSLAADKKFVSIVVGQVSPNGKYLPYNVDFEGDFQGTLYLKDLSSGSVRVVRKDDVKGTQTLWKVAFSSDEKYLYYSVPGSVGRDTRVARVDLTAAELKEENVYDETDTDFFLYLATSASGKYIFLVSLGNGLSVFRAIEADRPNAPIITFSTKRAGHDYSLDHSAGQFVIRSNRNTGQFALWTASEAKPQEEAWTQLETQTPIVEPNEITIFQEHVFVLGYKNVEQQALIISLRDRSVRALPKADPTTVFLPVDNVDPTASKIRLRVTSAIRPSSTVEFDLRSGEAKTLSQVSLPNYNPDLFEARRFDFQSADGTMVPSYVVKKKSLHNKSTPAIVIAYGHYAVPMLQDFTFRPSFGNEFISLLNRGVAFVIGFPRGAGDLGTDWANAGALDKKRKTLEDTVAIIKGLSEKRLSTPSRIAFKGHSAGGINVGFIANEAPTSLKALVASAPFVDVLNTMSDVTIPLTTQEFVVWGNPIESAKDYRYIKSYSPYDNIRKQPYPALYAYTSLRDSQVPYWESTKWVSRLQLHQTGANPIVIRIHMAGSHVGTVGEEAMLARSEEQAFILSQIGINQ